MLSRVLAIAVVAAATSAAVTAASAGAAGKTYSVRVAGAEYPPITQTLGTFAGASLGLLAGAWRVQIEHVPLSKTGSVPITGGTFRMQTLTHGLLRAPVTGGTITIVDAGRGCRNQTFSVQATLANGAFTGILTHHRRVLLAHCVIYAATIAGRATLSA